MPRQKNATTSFRFSEETQREIAWAAEVQRISKTTVIELAVQAYVRELRKQLAEQAKTESD